MPDEIEIKFEMDKLKSEFARRGLDLLAIWQPVEEDPKVHLRQLRRLLQWVEVYEIHQDRNILKKLGYEFPPVQPCIEPESDWLRFERWMAGQPVTHTLRDYLPDGQVFLPEEHLSDKELSEKIAILLDGLEKMNCQLAINQDIPIRLTYNFLVEYLDEPMEILVGGIWNLDGCTGYCPECFQRPWCLSGGNLLWQEDEAAGEMYLIDAVNSYVSPTRFSLEILKKNGIEKATF